MGADGLRRVGAVDAIDGAAEMLWRGAERVAGAAGHVTRQIGWRAIISGGGVQSGHSAFW